MHILYISNAFLKVCFNENSKSYFQNLNPTIHITKIKS